MIVTAAGLHYNTVDGWAWRGRDHVRLTRAEGAVLRLLAENAGRVVHRSRLLDAVSEVSRNSKATMDTLRVIILRLRRKLAEIHFPYTITSAYAEGYALDVPADMTSGALTRAEVAAIKALIAQAPRHVARAAEVARGALERMER